LARNSAQKLDITDCSFAHFTSILLLHYLVECRNHSLAIYDDEFILGSGAVQKIKLHVFFRHGVVVVVVVVVVVAALPLGNIVVT